ncbi:MAG: hypothetical protein LBJ70_03550 [Holosporales bacterium]|jgi:hypothetical protein|nr:hypothetical protein [Holosporales bacterium]
MNVALAPSKLILTRKNSVRIHPMHNKPIMGRPATCVNRGAFQDLSLKDGSVTLLLGPLEQG